MRALWLMLQQDIGDDYVVATGKAHSIRDLPDLAFRHVGVDGRPYVSHSPSLLRPAEVEVLVGDAGKAREMLGWRPEVDSAALVSMMVESDLALERSAPSAR